MTSALVRGSILPIPRPRPWDAVTVLKGFIVIQFVIPSDQRILSMGAAGSPAILYALGALVWWLWHRIRYTAPQRSGPARSLRAALYIFLAAMVAAYAAANVTALPISEQNMADMGMIRVVAMVGLVLVTADGIPSVERLMNFVRFLCGFGAAYASLGLFQFFTGISVIDAVVIPGLQSTGAVGVDERGGFVRAVATAMHPLEYATVLSMVLPLCIAVAVFDRKYSGFVRWYPVVVISMCSVLSVSRSALIGAAAVFLIMLPALPRAMRGVMIVMMCFGMAAVYALVPGMAGTIVGVFFEPDPSVSSRTGSYDIALEFLRVSPVFGRGLGTFLPTYHIFDNQFVLLLIETGALGFISFLLLLLVPMVVVLRCRGRFAQGPMQAIGVALLASLAAGALLSAFFDSLSFPQSESLIFLIIGVAGAYAALAPHSSKLVGREVQPR